MSEWKTLKDFEYKDFGKEYYSCNPEVLRIVAREWIKELKKELDNYPDSCFYLVRDNDNPRKEIYLLEEYETSDIRGAIIWIKHFFNLDDEGDVKQ